MTKNDLNKYLSKIDNIQRVSDDLADKSAEFAEFVIDAMDAAGVNTK